MVSVTAFMNGSCLISTAIYVHGWFVSEHHTVIYSLFTGGSCLNTIPSYTVCSQVSQFNGGLCLTTTVRLLRIIPFNSKCHDVWVSSVIGPWADQISSRHGGYITAQ